MHADPQRSLVGGDFACPNQSEAYLRVSYGDFKKVEYTYVDAGPAKARAQLTLSAIRRFTTCFNMPDTDRHDETD